MVGMREPPAERWYLDAATGSMSPNTATAASAEKSYPGLGDGLTFTSAPFTEETEFTAELSAYTITLSVIEGPEVVYVANRDSERGIGIHFRIGMRLPAVYTASGKALLASMSEAAFQEWLAFYPPMTWPEPVTAHSVRSSAALVEEIRGLENCQ